MQLVLVGAGKRTEAVEIRQEDRKKAREMGYERKDAEIFFYVPFGTTFLIG